jgi:CelD/BcsL family acetyltransferase involved in cellulose biosynthesis
MTSLLSIATEFATPEARPAERVVSDPVPLVPAQPAAVSVELASATRLTEIDAEWSDLLSRAHEANVFMDPAIIRLAGDGCATVLAWQQARTGRRLVGLWSFAIIRQWPVRILQSPPLPQAYLATPVIDRTDAETVLAAMLDFIAADSRLPKLIALDPIRSDGPTMRALAQVLSARGSAPYALNEGRRPVLASSLDAKAYFEKALSSSTRKKLRQHRRRLEEKGPVDNRVCTTPESIRDAFEDFLKLEAAGWKGQRGTALLCNKAEADFVRAMIAALAQRGNAAIHAIYQHGNAVASQVVLRAGSTAFTWKTAYDETLGDFSPGMLLLENYTAAFLADTSITLVDSCAFDESSFMSAWSEREQLARILLDARAGGSLVFRAVAAGQKSFIVLRGMAKALYLLWRRQWKKH